MLRSPSSTETAAAINAVRRQLFAFQGQEKEPSLEDEASYILSNLNITISNTEDLAKAVAWIDASRSFCDSQVYEMVIEGLKDHLKFNSEYACSLFHQVIGAILGSSWDSSVISYGFEDVTETMHLQLVGEVEKANILEE
jgi:hypothetical protein